MQIQELRQLAIDVARHTGMLLNTSDEIVEGFLTNGSDIRLTALDIESLALLEFCLIMEENHSIAITPKVFDKYSTLGEIVQHMSDNVNS